MDDVKEKRYLETLKKAAERIKQLTAQVAELRGGGAIAVIGVGCRFPGGANSPSAYWELLRTGRDVIREVPPSRWPAAEYHAAEKGKRGRTYTAMGGFLDNVDGFDADFFGISPPEATAMDPQQRLLLEVTHEALEDARLDPDRLRGSRTGVFAGMSTRDYLQAHVDSGDPKRIDQYSMTGAAFSVSVGRISYFYDLRGPSVAVDTACSSSLVAVHLAVGSLRRRETDLALAGGVNLMLTPEPFIGFSQLQALSPDGRCYSFDDRANGYVRGEGCGLIVLKRLADAEADGDRILAVIKGTAVNQDGESSGLTAPNALSQRDLIQEALADGGLDPEAVDYIECHGTGTALGDPIEARALGMVFGKRSRKLLIGSAKSNIGHLESAAGIAGIIKAILALQHGEIPANLHFETPSRHIPWQTLPLEVVARARAWPSSDKPAVVGISSFGFSGTNAHVVMTGPAAEPSALQPEEGIEPQGGLHILPISAKSPAALEALAGQYRVQLSEAPDRFADVCHAAATGRKHFKHRLAILGADGAEAARSLDAFADGRPDASVVPPAEHGANDSGVVFMYSGQGAQYAGMTEALYRAEPEFRGAVDECAELLRARGIDVIDLLYGPARDEEALRQTCNTQPALFVVEYALTRLLRSWGVKPAAVFGHSIGEYAAACAADVFSLQEALTLTAERGRLLQELPEAGALAAVFAAEDRVREALDGHGDRVSVAAVNAPENTVIAGGAREIEAVLARLEARGVRAKRLNASHAFHSALVEPAIAPFAGVFHGIQPRPPQIPLFSTVTATQLTAEEAVTPGYWCRQIREPVRFADTARNLYGRGYRTFLEVGPHAVLTALCQQSIGAPDATFIPTLIRGEADVRRMVSSLGQLYVRGVDVNWSGLHRGRRARAVELPLYPFQRSRYWLDPVRRGGAASSEARREDIGLQAIDLGSSAPQPHGRDEESGIEAPEHLRARVRDELKKMVQDISEIDAAQIDPEVNLFRLGLSSIALTQLRQRIDHRYEIEMPMVSFYRETDTLEKLSAHVAANLPESARQSLRIASPSPAPASPVSLTSERQEPALAGALAGASDDSVKEIIHQQLRLMARQLDLLQGAAPSKNRESPLRAPSPALPAISAPPPMAKATNDRARHEKVDLRSMTLIEDALTPRQAEFVRGFTAEYGRLTQKSKAMMAAHRPVFSDWINSLGFRRSLKEIIYPVVAHRSEGARIWDVDGREYIDMAIGYGVNYFGNKPDFIAKAVVEQLSAGYHLGPQFDLTAEVAERIRALTGVERVTFTNTGTEAVMTALRIARTVTGRDKIVIFAGSYHGTFDGILAQDRNGETQPAAPGTTRNMVRDVMVLEYGAERSLEIIASCASELAAVLVEPVQSRNPSLQPRAFLQRLRAITAESKTALIFDEIITGFRLCPGGAQAYFGVRADLVTYGKVLGGGMPLGVIGGAARWMDAIDGGPWSFGDDSIPTKAVTFFGGTFCKHPLAMVAALAVLKRVADAGPSLQRDVNRRTARFAAALNAFFEAERVPLRVRHCASFFRFESCGEYDADLQPITIDLLFYLLLSRGVYTWERRICFFSTAHTDADADLVIETIKASVAELRAAGFPFLDASPAEIEREPRRSPLSSAQRGIYFLSQLPGGESAYHVTVAARMDGTISADRVEDALRILVARHDALRTGFVASAADAGGPAQEVHPRAAVRLIEMQIDGAEIDRAIREIAAPFNLAEPPLLRAALLRIADRDHILVLDAHHLIADGAAFDTLVIEFIAAYQGLPLPPARAQYDAYVAWERGLQGSDKLAAQRRYWLDRFADEIPRLELPTDAPRGPRQSFRGAAVHGELDLTKTARLRALARDLDATLFTVLLSSFYLLLAHLSGQDDIVIGTAVDHRSAGDFAGTVGTFARTLALRSRVEANASFRQWVGQIKANVLADIDHQDFPFDALVDALGLPRDMSRNPLFDVMFVFEQAARRVVRSHDLVFSQHEIDPAFTSFDLTLSFVDEGEVLRWSLSYCPDLFEERTIRTWAHHLTTILDRVAAEPAVTLADIDLLDAAERRRVTETWNQTEAPFPSDTSVVALIERQVAAAPERVALVDGDQEWTYAALHDGADRLARHLTGARGVRSTDAVVVMGSPSARLVMALLAVAKTGAAFVPMDPATPRERLAFILEDTGAKVLLTERALAEATESRCCEAVFWDDPTLAGPEGSLPALTRPEQVFYIIYTSGTTGRPKGVMIHNRGLVNYLTWFAEAFGINADDSFVLASSFAYDMAHTSIWAPLVRGGRLHVLGDEARRSPQRFADYLRHQRISCLKITPSFFRFLAGSADGAGAPELPDLRLVVLGGEAIQRADVARFLRANPAARVVDEYGPTEITIACTARVIDAAGLAAYLRRPSIGKPIHNTAVYILDPRGRPLPSGLVGEICVGGAGVAAGYLKRDDLNRSRFVEYPHLPCRRVYRTGDRGRFLPDGSIELLGRIDDQLKIRGYRLELGEIEQVLLRHPQVEAASVLPVGEDAMSRTLVAFLVHRRGGELDPGAYLRGHLPAHMIPARFIELAQMPLTANGKVDKRALRRLLTEAHVEPPRDKDANDMGDIEAALLRTWREVLSAARLGVHDDFFAAGGDSIKALLIVARLKQAGFQLDLYHLFQYPTIAALAAQVTRGAAQGEQGLVTGELSLTAAQARWLHHQGEPRDRYCLAVLLTAKEPLDARALDQAFQHLQLHHDALRTRFTADGAALLPEIGGPEAVVALETVKLRAGRDSDEEAAFVAAARRVPGEVSLTRGPLLKASLFQLEHEDRLLIVIHHMVVDGLSWRVLLEDLVTAYTQALAGHTPRLPGKTASIKAWARQVDAYAHGEAHRAEVDAWRKLAREAGARLPLDLDRAAERYLQKDRAVVSGALDPKATELLTRAARSVFGAGVQEVLLTALARALKRRYGLTSIAVDMESHGRNPPPVAPFRDAESAVDVSRTVGWFTAIYPFVWALPETDDLGEQIVTMREALAEAPSGGFGYGIARHLGEDGAPLFGEEPARIGFNYLGRFEAASGVGPFVAVREWTDSTIDPSVRCDHALHVEAQVLGDRLTWSFHYDAQAFAPGTIAALTSLFEESLCAAVQRCEERVGAAAALPDAIGHGSSPEEWDELLTRHALERDRVLAVYPLSPMQEGMLFSALLRRGGAAYHEQFVMRIHGSLDPARFEASWHALVARHDIFRTVFVHKGAARPLQVVLRAQRAAFTFVDHSAMSPIERARRLEELKADDLKRPFDLARGPLLRVYLQRGAADEFRLVWSYHHILMDGWSTGIVIRELLHLYGARLHGGDGGELPPVVPYRSYIQWLEQEDWTPTRQYWREVLAGYERPATLPRGSAPPEEPGEISLRSLVFDLSEAATERLKAVAAGYRVTLSSLLQSLWGLLVAHYNGTDDVVIGAVVSGRPAHLPGVAQMAGLFLNTLPLRIRTAGCERMPALASAVQRSMLTSEPHQCYALAEILGLSPLRQALFDHVVVFENYPLSQELERLPEYDRLGFKVSDIQGFEQTDYDFHMEINPGARLSFKMSYSARAFGADQVHTFKAHLERLIERVSEEPGAEIAALRELLVSREARREHERYLQSILDVDDVIT